MATRRIRKKSRAKKAASKAGKKSSTGRAARVTRRTSTTRTTAQSRRLAPTTKETYTATIVITTQTSQGKGGTTVKVKSSPTCTKGGPVVVIPTGIGESC